MVSNWQIKKNFYTKSLIIFFTLISFFFLNSNFYNAKNAKDQTTNLIKAISTHDNNISNFFYRGELVGDYHRFIKTIKNSSYNKIYIREKLNKHGLCEINKCKFNIYFKKDKKIDNEFSKEIIFLLPLTISF